MNKKNFSAQEMLEMSQMSQVKGGGLAEDIRAAYTTAKGTPVSTTTTSKPTSVRGDELVVKTISTISTVGTQLNASAQDIYVATSVALAALPYLKK